MLTITRLDPGHCRWCDCCAGQVPAVYEVEGRVVYMLLCAEHLAAVEEGARVMRVQKKDRWKSVR